MLANWIKVEAMEIEKSWQFVTGMQNSIFYTSPVVSNILCNIYILSHI